MEYSVIVNDVFIDKNINKIFRVIWTSDDSSFHYVIAMEGETGLPIKMLHKDIINGFSDGHLEKIVDPIKIDSEKVSDGKKERRDKLWSILQGVLCDEPAIYEKSTRGKLLTELSDKTGISKANLYKYLKRYWTYGKVPNAFLPNYLTCGGRGKERHSSSSGRPRENAQMYGKVLDEKDYVNFEYVIRTYYLTSEAPTMAETFQKLLDDKYSYIDENGKKIYFPNGQLPSLRQLRYWYHKNYDIKQEVQARKGETEFELSTRAVTGKADFGLMGPGSQFQVDATIGDIYLVSKFDRRDIIGRPVIYFVIDSYSRMVVGMYVGLEGPSWAGMMEALYNASIDKVSYCRQYGIEITEEQWPCHHVPAVLLGDRGELESHKADKLVSELGIRVDNAPPFRGDLKPIIESYFKTMNSFVTPFLPGKIVKKRRGNKYKLDAVLDLQQITQIIISCVIYYNNHHYLSNFNKNAQMLQSSVEAIPIKLWNWGVQNQSGALRSFPEETVRLALLPSDNASVTKEGIKFKKLLYSSPEVRETLWFENARKKGRKQVRISYDPRDLSRIYVFDNSSKKYILCELIDWNNKYAGMNLAEINFEQAKQEREKNSNERQDMEGKANLHFAIEAIVEKAKEMTPNTTGIPKTRRIANIKANRAREKAVVRTDESFVSGKLGLEPVEIYQQILPVNSDKEETLSPEVLKIAEQAEEDYKRWELSMMQYTTSKDSQNTETTH